MSFCFRYRVKMLTPPADDKAETSTLTLMGLPPVTVRVSDAFPFGKWVVFTARGFESEEDARNAGNQFGDILLAAGTLNKLGVDIGFGQPTLRLSKDLVVEARRATGRSLLPETHGLMTYEKDTVTIQNFEAFGSSSINPKVFESHYNDWAFVAGNLTERQRTCASLLGDSVFVSNTEGRFILCVSAVEALCDQAEVGSEYLEAIDAITDRAAAVPMSDDIRESVKLILTNARRRSLRQSYMSKFRTLLTEEKARAFDELYKKRSKLVHAGSGRGGLLHSSNEAMNLAVELLAADVRAIQHSAPPPFLNDR